MHMRICSFLPSTTEIVCALGLEENLVGITHECDYPPQVLSKPRTIKSSIDSNSLSSKQIDEFVAQKSKEGKSIYLVNIDELKEASPDIIFTQNLCEVCAVSGDEVIEAAKVLNKTPEIVTFEPHTVDEVLETIIVMGEITNTKKRAEDLVENLQKRIDFVKEKLANQRDRPRVFCLEWLDPPFVAGHWVPEMVEIAGGTCGLSATGEVSKKVSWLDIAEFAPNYMLVIPCGFGLERTLDEIDKIISVNEWHQLPSTRKGHSYIVNGNSYFSRPSPRIVDGIEIIAKIVHPDIFKNELPENSVINLRNYFQMQSFLG